MDFASKSGSMTVISKDDKSILNIVISDLASNGYIVGDGTFLTSQDRYTYTVPCSLGSFSGCSPQVITTSFDNISEISLFGGTIAGTNGSGAAGIAIGNNHEIGVSMEIDNPKVR